MIHNGRTINVETYCIERKNPKGNESLRYVLEVENCCPKCGKTIMNFSADKKKLYEIAHIFPNRPTEEEKKILADVEVLGDDSECFENKIALCRDCHKEYDEHKTVEKYNDMLNLKKKLLKSCNAKTDLSHNMIEDELFDVVKKISSLATDNDVLSKCEPLSYNVMSIKEKIPFNNLLWIVYFGTPDFVVKPIDKVNIIYSAPFFVAGGMIYLYRQGIKNWVEKHRMIALAS